jgi:hypothetical protein
MAGVQRQNHTTRVLKAAGHFKYNLAKIDGREALVVLFPHL